ncbi:hypothetical protein P4O66_001661 [Electrophorus voltai]|uniref:Uncharacterized protein n=1 Tax=Electrophorus voltai TaxID=2609070 RepID=A0AAD8Z5G8_9TELE|nr:hypothetical protein P4O66_001661 [Electrophorus voltai]
MRQVIQAITNYRPSSPACDRDASLPHVLNDFYAQFEAESNVMARNSTPAPPTQVLCLTVDDVRKTLRSVNPRKAAGPDNILAEYSAEQLADGHLQHVPEQHHHPYVLQGLRQCLSVSRVLPQRPPSCHTHAHHREMLQEAHRDTADHPPPHPGPPTVHISTYYTIPTTLHLALTHLDYKDAC